MALLADRSKIEQIVVEFFAKSLHIILESRIPALCTESDYAGSFSSSSSSGPKTRDRWFNLALGDCTAALQNFEPWRRSFSDPMIVDILLDQRKPMEKNSSSARTVSQDRSWVQNAAPLKGRVEDLGIADEGNVLERWTVQFEQRKKGYTSSSDLLSKTGDAHNMKKASKIGATESQDNKEAGSEIRSQKPEIQIGESSARSIGVNPLPIYVTEVPAVYKRTVIMLRSLYSKCRLLPTYRLFRLANSPANCCNFSLTYRVLASVLPFSGYGDRDMPLYSFAPVETLYGRMCLSVAYQQNTSVVALEVVPSILPRIIPDYVGSPTTDPLKRFTGDPRSLPSGGMPINRGIRLVSVPSSLRNSPPPDLLLGRRHSWSGRINQVQPVLLPPSSPSYLNCIQPAIIDKHGSPSQPISIDNCAIPSFSPSPSPSPPSYPVCAPVIIPKVSHSRGTKLLVGDAHQHSRNLLPPLSPSARKLGPSLRSSSGSPRYSGKLYPRSDQLSSFESSMQLYMMNDDAQQVWNSEGNQPDFPPENPITGLSQTTLLMSSSKAVLGNDVEDEDFSCPFAVDDMDMEENCSSGSRLLGTKGKVFESSTSGSSQQIFQDAAVGALIRVFKSAQPLRRSSCLDLSVELDSKRRSPMSPRGMARELKNKASSGPFFPSKKTASDALEELQLYKMTRDLLHTHNEREDIL